MLLYISLFFVYCRGFEPGAFKMVKISLKKLKLSRLFHPVSFRVVIQDDTTELQDYITNLGNTT